MIVVDCPTRGRILIGYSQLLALVNHEPGVIVVGWSCRCGDKHAAVTGRVGSADPTRAAAALATVKQRLAI
jgi:hypothetical protein